ncbi:MAG: hypothetical protein IKI29_05345 [Clostridia bacterium]|nr:hypothetical protein [Clostridia bacterium]
MKRSLVIFSLICCLLLLCSFPFTPAVSSVVAETTGANENQVLTARFLNMLNHNLAYGKDFYDTEVLTKDAVVSLATGRSVADGDYVAVDAVRDFLFSMYGVQKTDFSDFQTGWPQKEGYVYIVPCGYTTYRHDLITAEKNEDGSFSVTTAVTVTPHDGKLEHYECHALFLENSASQFGYQLLSADLLAQTTV